MPSFTYTARDKAGQLARGHQEAATQEELLTILHGRGLVVTGIDRSAAAAARGLVAQPVPSLVSRRREHRRVQLDDLTLFSRQLATLLAAGVPLLRCLDVTAKQMESRRLRQAVEQMHRDIQSGSTLRDALAKHPGIFSPFWMNLAETGEASGHLPAVLEQLARHLERMGDLQRKIGSAMVYPAILIVVAVAAVVIFMVKIIPVFSGVFVAAGADLPLLTRWVVRVSDFFRSYVVALGLVAVGLVQCARWYGRTPRGRLLLDRVKCRLPAVGELLQFLYVARFASGLSTMVRAGVPLLFALDIASSTVGNVLVERVLARVREAVRQGSGMAEPLAASGIFPPMVSQMVSVGEEIGELGQMLGQVATFYEERANAMVQRLSAAVEPAIIIVLGLVVGTMVVAMFLPIVRLSGLPASL